MMARVKFILCLLALFVLPGSAMAQTDAPIEIIPLGEDSQRLIDDFNARAGTVRQVFIIGPTCGVCLRGMADLNSAYIAERQGDPRLHTFVVYVPALQATAADVPPVAELMAGPRIDHYWQESGMIGVDYQPIFETEIYIWDFWFIYGPDAVWEGDMPPVPDFWQHQLRGRFPADRYLDKEVFTAEVIAMIEALPERTDQLAQSSETAGSAGSVVIPTVAQGFGVPIRQYRESQGGQAAIDAVASRTLTGHLTTADAVYDLRVSHARPNILQRQLFDAEGQPASAELPDEVVSHLSASFDFDRPLINWQAKGHQFTMEGAELLDGLLYWNLVQTDPDGRRWAYLVETHTGTIAREQAFDMDGNLTLVVVNSDFREVDGAQRAHRVEYRAPDGAVHWVEEYDTIAIVPTEQ